MKRIKKGQKAQSEIITTILLILLVLVAIIIVWQVIKRTVVKGTEGVGIGAFTTSLEIQEAKLWITGGAEVKVHRGAGEGEITSLKFIFEKADGETEIITRKAPDYKMPDELETKVYDFTLNEINEKIEKVSVAPIFGNNAGITVPEDEREIEKDSSGERILDAPVDLISWWMFDGNAEDGVGGNHGTPNGGVDLNYNDAIRGEVASFDGDGDYVNTGTPTIGNKFTISAWINTNINTTGVWRHVFSRDTNGIGYGTGGDMKMRLTKVNIADGPASNSVIGKNQWYHVAVTFDNTNNMTTYYLNGVNDGGGQFNVVFSETSTRIGNSLGYDAFWNGTIDDVMIFNKALTEAEIQAIYNNQKK